MINLNKVQLVGRLTKKPELKQTTNGKNYCYFSVAVNRRYQKETADYISCVAWNQNASFLCQYGDKGNMVCVEGEIQTRNYDGADGKKVYVTEVVADNISLESSNKTTTDASASKKEPDEFLSLVESDDLPFY